MTQHPPNGRHRLLAVKGALDGGLDIPHSEKRFVGYSADDKSLDAEVLRKHIYGGHVAEYMEEMQEEAPEKYQVPIGLVPDAAKQIYAMRRAAICLCRMHPDAEDTLPAAALE